MRFGVLGPLAAWTADGTPVPIPGVKVRALLAALLLNEGRMVSADRLIEDLWGDDPPRRNPLGALSAKVSQLRRAFEDAEPGARELVVSRPPGYQLRLADDVVDAQRFRTLTARAREADDAKVKAVLLSDAVALWRGPAFADFADEPFTQAAIAHLEEQRLIALEDAAEARLTLGEHTVLVGELGELLVAHPLRERLRAAHMRALYGAGRQSEALDSYEELRTRLADELGLDPGPDLATLQRAILTQDLETPAPAARAPGPRSNLPAALTELIGRDSAIAEVESLLRTERLVTLTGPGGVGKTRLAIETARTLQDTLARDKGERVEAPDGVWLAELAGTHAGSVADAVAAALDVRESESGDLAAALRGRSLLLLLDNCEHVIDEAAALAETLLRVAPGLRVLATSREPLGLAGEVVWSVPPLEVPARDADLGALDRSSAVKLFVARAAAAARGFTLDADSAHAVGLLCRRLDGIPLALELAATRVRALGVQGVADRLDDRFRLLAVGHRGAPPRQQTLTAMIDWSWELLTAAEQTVLRRLAVHADGCTLESAESVCQVARESAESAESAESGEDGRGGPEDLDVLDLLVRLVDRSLVAVVQTADGPRYRLLESVAAYCVERLREAGEYEQVRRRHRDHYLALAERAELRGPEQRRWLRCLDAEAANLRAVLDDALAQRDAEVGLRLVNALAWYWFLRGRLAEARRSFEAVLAIAGDDAPAAGRARAWLAGFAYLQGDTTYRDTLPDSPGTEWFLIFAGLAHGDVADADKRLVRIIETCQAEGDRWGEAAALMTRANLAHIRSDLAVLEHDAARSTELFTELGDRWGQLGATGWLAALSDLTGDHAHAVRLHGDALRLAEKLGLWPEVANRLCWLGWLKSQLGDQPTALEYGRRALRLATEQGHQTGTIFAETVLGSAARKHGDLDLAESVLRRLLDTSPRPVDGSPAVHVPMVLTELGLVAEQRGDADAARDLHLEAFDLAGRLGAPGDQVWALEGLAGALALAGEHIHAAELLGAAATARRTASLPGSPAEQAALARITTGCRAALGEDGFAAAYARGLARSPDTARRLAVKPG